MKVISESYDLLSDCLNPIRDYQPRDRYSTLLLLPLAAGQATQGQAVKKSADAYAVHL